MYNIVVIGGGASGLMAGVSAAEEYRKQNKNYKIIILEGNQKLGKKLLATGNGRCNLSNWDLSEANFFGDYKKFAPILQKYDTQSILDSFKEMGLLTVTDSEGRIYPYNKQASAVLEILKLRAEELKIDMKFEFNVDSVTKYKNIFRIKSKDQVINAEKIILATGGMASPRHSSSMDGYKILNSMGHNVTKTYPTLVQLKCEDKFIRNLSGVRAVSKICLMGDNENLLEETGEVMFGNKSISGICVFQLSVMASEFFSKGNIQGKRYKELSVKIDLAPNLTYSELLEFLTNYKKIHPNTPCNQFLDGVVNTKISKEIIKLCKVDKLYTISNLTEKDIKSICNKIKNINLNIQGTKGFDDAQVTGGGLTLDEVNLNTLESCKVKRLYVCGELLNIHGKCGGFNLHLAWASGKVAGFSAANERE